MAEMSNGELRAGLEIPPVTHKVTRRNILRYGRMVGAFNPVHEEDGFAEEVGFEGIIAHGVMHLNYITEILCGFAGHPEGVKRIDVRFLKPVYPGEEITARAVITSVEDTGGRPRVHCAVWSEKMDGTRVIEGTAVLEIMGSEGDPE